MIPDNIQQEHLLAAMAEIDRQGVPARQQSRRYDLFYNGKSYPPKLVVRIASRLVNRQELPILTSVQETNDFLTKRGFTIIFKPVAMLVEEEPAIEYSEWVLQKLLDYQETHPDFYFLTRTNKKRDLLEAGHWLPGTDYLHVALTHSKNGDSINRSVGFQIDFSEAGHPRAAFVVRFKRERRREIIAFYKALLEQLAPYGMQAEKPDFFILRYGEDVLAAMNLFLERDVPVFQALLNALELKETLGISPKRFSRKMTKVLAVEEEGVEYKKSRLARLCWNTNGWVMPSGPAGKDIEQSTPGFHYDEWLLDLDKILSDGYHYGFLRPVDQEWPAHAGKKFFIRLYTFSQLDKQYYWIGELRSAEVIDQSKAVAVERVYRKKGWLPAMGEQLRRIGLDPALLTERPKEAGALFNVRFVPENVYIYQDLRPFSPFEAAEINDQHYAFVKASGMNAEDPAQSAGFYFRPAAPPANLPETIIRRFEHRAVEFPYLHGKIQQGLYNWLKEQYGEEQVSHEQPTGSGGSRIDLAVQLAANEYVFYEIKTFNSLMICIRLAMGQLLEYAFFPTGRQASRLVIVSYHRPEQSALDYLENIRQQTGLPVYYGYFDLESGELVE